MKLFNLFSIAALAVSLVACSSTPPSEKASKQDEIRQATRQSLDKFYKAKPELQSEVAAAPGYAVFTTYGISFIVGGAGGKGLVRDNQTGKEYFMDAAQASAGLQAGAAQTDTLIVFKNSKALNEFVDKGWTAGGQAVAQAGAGGESHGPGTGENVIADAKYYTLTPNGLQAGVAAAGTKYWKDKNLN
jgi:lipid-binding SYLF domain-containing protein